MSDEEITKANIIDTARGRAFDLSSQTPGAPIAAPGEGADWFGPLVPMRPVAPPEVAGRQLDYAVGFNLATQPRFDEPVSFSSLRALAEAYDPIRLIIERRKDQLTRLPWSIRPK